ncbi:MAG: family ATPase [Cryobacterium sp.]|nr:family ATPase [Cryobacterium sp.]
MPALSDYGQVIAATTQALQQLLAPVAPQITARTLFAAREDVSGVSVNLFLYRDQLVRYRIGTEPLEHSNALAELSYLVTAFAADAADLEAASQRAYGNARAVIERHAVVTVPLGSAGTLQVRLTPSGVEQDDLTRMWLASLAPYTVSFGVTASFPLSGDRGSRLASLAELTRAGAGAIAVFTGTDAAAKSAAAASVARERNGSVVKVPLGEVVSKYIGETEHNLRRLFQRMENRNAVLVLDESDALFGRRTEPRDTHDRYADVDATRVLDVLAEAPGLVIVVIGAEAGAELATRAAIDVRFPPDEP